MNRPHATLRLGTNVVIIIVWASATILFAALSKPLPVAQLVTGCALGIAGGYMQLLSFREGRENFLQAKTAMEVRARLKETKWGKRYIYFLWSAGVVLVAPSIFASGNPLFSFPSAYFGMMFAREIVTLKSTLELSRIQSS